MGPCFFTLLPTICPKEIFSSFLNNYFHHYIITDVMCLKFCSPTDSVLLWERSAYRSTRRFTTVRNLTYALSINAGMHQISALRQTCLSHAPSANRSIYQARPCMPSGGSPGLGVPSCRPRLCMKAYMHCAGSAPMCPPRVLPANACVSGF